MVGKLPVDHTKEILTKKTKILTYFISELVRDSFEVPHDVITDGDLRQRQAHSVKISF